jgi:uncharacterized repeat protein (TIGR01451 family)
MKIENVYKKAIVIVVVVIAVPFPVFALNDAHISDDTIFEFNTFDTAVSETIVASSGGQATSFDVQSNYIDITLDTLSSVTFATMAAGQYLKIIKQSGSDDYTVSPSCPTTTATLIGAGASVVLRLEVLTTNTCVAPPVTSSGGSSGGSGSYLSIISPAIRVTKIHVTKVSSPLALPVGGGMVTYTNTVTNPGTVPLRNINLVDDTCGPVTYISGDKNGDSNLDPGETWIYACSANLTKTTTNIVVATGQTTGLTASDFATTTVVVAVPSFPNTGSTSSADLNRQVKAIKSTLVKGNRGASVRILQQFLISQKKGPASEVLAKNGTTTYFGILTRAALAEFQLSEGINPHLGNFGPITRAYLKSHY